jgi:predicted nucleic-acid-binding protein
MQGLDTNVLVRFVVDDDPVQCAQARRLAASLTPSDPGYVTSVVAVEFAWVLRRTYRFPNTTVIATLRKLLGSPSLVFEGSGDLEAALHAAENAGCEIPDALIAVRCRRAGCAQTHTFDQKAAALDGMVLVTRAPAAGPGGEAAVAAPAPDHDPAAD